VGAGDTKESQEIGALEIDVPLWEGCCGEFDSGAISGEAFMLIFILHS
jgi:hypothetical protein